MYLSCMKSVPLKELKENLASWAEEASKGETVQVTKYNRPYIVLSAGKTPGLYQGGKVGREVLRSVLKEATCGQWLRYLAEDRDD